MEFRIADTFTDSLAKLTGDEQKAVKTTAFDLQLNPTQPGLQFHKLEKPKDPNFRSVRVNLDVRLIVHRSEGSLLLCYVGHHDAAYQWAERRKLQIHPKTGAAQLVELRETVQDIVIPRYVEVEQAAPPKPPLFANVPEQELLSYGVPPEWMADVRNANEDTVLEVAGHLPAEAAEALLDLAIGVTPKAAPAAAHTDPFEHPDARRRFRVMNNAEELERALDYPWEKWTVFLHPAQRQLVERDYNGPARASGSAGTGKTIVALHRAVFLARANPDARVLLTTFSDTLSNALRAKLRRLIGNEPRLGERVEVHSMNALGRRLYEMHCGRSTAEPQRTLSRTQRRGNTGQRAEDTEHGGVVSPEVVAKLLEDAATAVGGHKFSRRFLITEWEQVVDAWQLETWESYRDVSRLGRKTRLPENHRAVLWSIFERVRSGLKGQGLVTYSELFSKLAAKFGKGAPSPYDFAVVDEAQDVSVAQLRFLAAMGGGRANRLFFAGDLGQRIFQQPFSWKALGVDIRGRSSTLRINYRTSHQIRMQADRLLSPDLSDVDGNTERRNGTISLFNGPAPEIAVLESQDGEVQAVAGWIKARVAEGVTANEIGVFVRSAAEMERAIGAVTASGLAYQALDENVETISGRVSISTMHLAKGLEFRAVAVMACDDEVIPLQERIETVSDDADLEEVYNTERHLLYVACTRARDHLLVTSVGPASEFLDDLRLE
jgi:superfamily I DNA/RNA helicase/mRNA-degrading endonuclease RelE of RelBE toxin-antitoxin system